MNILDENIPKPQRELLEGRGISVRQVGVNIGRKGLLDEEIIPLLQRLRHPTFFTRDSDFYDRRLCHYRSPGPTPNSDHPESTTDQPPNASPHPMITH